MLGHHGRVRREVRRLSLWRCTFLVVFRGKIHQLCGPLLTCVYPWRLTPLPKIRQDAALSFVRSKFTPPFDGPEPGRCVKNLRERPAQDSASHDGVCRPMLLDNLNKIRKPGAPCKDWKLAPTPDYLAYVIRRSPLPGIAVGIGSAGWPAWH